ncbi:MAG: FAD-dependent oxidoreductase [Phormidesmis sp.]
MPVDYDLVILGGTAYARTAALQAVRYGARVALVEPPGLFEQRQRQTYLLESLQQIGLSLQRQAVDEQFGLTNGGQLAWPRLLEWGAIAADTQSAQIAVEAMSARGVDVVLEAPQRLTRQLATITKNRHLRARGVLAAYGKLPTVIETLQRAPKLPSSIKIEGGTPEAIAWACALNHCGVRITLIAEGDILPHEDRDIRRLVRSRLIASGINLQTESPAEPPAEHRQLSEDTSEKETSQEDSSQEDISQEDISQSEYTLKIATAPPLLELPSFIKLKTNRRLQTSHPRLFACGSILGGSTEESLGQYEATVALQNALFVPRINVEYESTLQTSAQFARIGLTEAQAEKRYGNALQVFMATGANATCLNQMSPSPDYCKLICAGHRLVGVHLLGSGAGDVAQGLRSHMGQPIQALNVIATGGLLALVAASANQAKQRQWQPKQWRRDWAENWFNWRRSQ